MKRAAASLCSLVLGLSVVGAMHRAPVIPPMPTMLRHADSAAGVIAHRIVVLPKMNTLTRVGGDRQALRRKVEQNEAGTYIGDILAERDSAIIRWPDRHGQPLAVWVQPESRVRDFVPELAAEVRDAFETWDDVGLPVQFDFTTDSAAADIHVTWIDHFNEPISGRTRWARDDDYRITDANITLAVHHYQGELLDPDAMRAMALHEIGHLLGLDHTSDSLSIMAPRVRVRSLMPEDRATARLIYSLPAGQIG